MADEVFGRHLHYLELNTLLQGWSASFQMDVHSTGMPWRHGDRFFKLAVRSFHFVEDVAHEELSAMIATPAVVVPVVPSSVPSFVVSLPLNND